MYVVYVIQSEMTAKYYIGYTGDLAKRLLKHNAGSNRSTKYGKPWKVVHIEKFESRSEAYKRERQIKKMKSGAQFKALINGGVG